MNEQLEICKLKRPKQYHPLPGWLKLKKITGNTKCQQGQGADSNIISTASLNKTLTGVLVQVAVTNMAETWT